MQYASGGELYEYVSDRKVLSDNEARRLFRQIATAVYYCHKNKVCHRDLKLENILLDHNGNAKIADFGLSNVFDEKHFLNTFCGSPLYASPEIVKGIPYYGAEVDCWSLGVLLYTLVYGAMPFDGSNFKRLVKQISESSYFEPKQKSEASGLIRRLLAVDPTKRATIIDICTDWWVNKGYEHSLLQVAEDLANLTPVRLDVLLALAPISPPVESGNGQNPLSGQEGDLSVVSSGGKPKRVKSKSSRSDENLYPSSTAAIDYQADTSELSNDIPTYPEEEEEELIDASENVDDGDEFLPSAVAAALQDECQESVKQQQPLQDNMVTGAQDLSMDLPEENSSEPGKSSKRIAGSSIDSNSVSRVSSHVMKHKKPKKGSEDAIVTQSEDHQVTSSGYISDGTSVTGGTFPPSQIVTDDLTQPIMLTEDNESVTLRGEDDDTTMLNKTSTVPYDSLPDENVSISSQISSLPETGRDSRNAKLESVSGITTSKTQSSASIETLTAKDDESTPSSQIEMNSSSSTLIDDQQKLTRQNSISRSSVKSKSKSASPKRPTPSKTSSSSFTSTSSSSTIISGKQPRPSSSSSPSSSTTVSNSSSTINSSKCRIKSGDKIVNRKSAKESPPKGIKGKLEGSTTTSPSTSTVTTTETSSTLKESPSTSAPGSEASESVPTTPDADKTKPWLERRASVDRKVGKISYPKFLENKSAPEKKPVPTYGKISTAKKLFETRRSSVDKDKERVIPMVKVSDAKRAFERRASMPASQSTLLRNASERKASLIQQSSLDETSSAINSERNQNLSKDKSSSVENNNNSKPLSSRPRKSPSSPIKSRSPNKSPVKTITGKQSTDSKTDQVNKSIESKQSETIKDSQVKPKVKSTSSIVIDNGTKKIGTSSEVKKEIKSIDNQSSEMRPNESVSELIESPSILDNKEERKSLAKDVIKKQIAKAKLQELRQSSIESHESNLSVSSDQHHGTKLTCQSGSEEKPKSYVKSPKPFIKEEIKPTPVRSVAEIKLSSKPKLGLDIEAAHRGQQKHQQLKHQEEIEEITPTNIIEPPSTAGTVQNQESNPGTPSTAATTVTTQSKAAPITRSYKKVTFTKDGACITETGKIISEESADGSFSRIEKKSKVTHYPVASGSGAPTTRSESSEETRTIKNFGGSVKSSSGGVGDGDSFDESRNGSVSPSPVLSSTSGLCRSESASSSGSTDIFDDIFDTWSGDPVFGNISGRMRSMLSSSRSPFTSLWGTGRNKKGKKKSRAESAERKPTTETLTGGSNRRRVAGHGTDQEFSDTDTDTEPSMGFGSTGSGGGLWKFLGPTAPSSSNLIDRHRSLLSRHFGSDDFFSDAEPFGSSFRRSLSRDRGSTSFGTTRNSSAAGTPTMRMVVNPLRNPRSSINRMTSTTTKQDSLDSNESGGSNTQHVPTPFSSQPVTGRPYSRTISRESQRQRVGGIDEKSTGGGNSFDLDDGSVGPSSRGRVEQWLDMNRDDEEIGTNHPISMYTTIRPRSANRYGRSVSSRFGFDLGSVDSPRDTFQGPSGGSNLSFSTTQEIQIGSPSSSSRPETPTRTSTNTTTGKPRAEVIIPVGRSNVSSPSMATSSQGKPLITMKLSLGGGNEPREVRTFISSGSGGGLGGGGLTGSTSTTGIVETPGTADSFGGDWSSSILLPESSSLLDQLRTHGYRNLVSQRLSGLSGPTVESRYDNRDNSCVSSSSTTTTTSTTTTPTTNTTVNLPPQQMKRGKSLTGDSSSIRNLENLIVKNGQNYIAWSNPVNGQSSTIIKSTNNNRMPNKTMDQSITTNPDSDNIITVNHNDKQLNSCNRVVKVVSKPVVVNDDDQSVGVKNSNNQINWIDKNDQINQNYDNIQFIDEGNGDDGDDINNIRFKSTINFNPINCETGKLIKDNDEDNFEIMNNKTNIKSKFDTKNDQKETTTINIPINIISSSQNNGKSCTSYFSSSITKVTSSLPPKPKSFNTKHDLDAKSLIDESQLNHHHHHPKLNRKHNQVHPFNFAKGEPLTPSPPPPPPPQPTTTSKTFNREGNHQHHHHQQQEHQQQPEQNEHQNRKKQFNDIKTCNNNNLLSKDENDETINRKNVNNNDDNSHRSLSNSTNTNTTTTNDPHHKETLAERILRKSYYSRFNHPLERRASSVRRRTSMIENGDRLMDFSLFDNFSRPHYPSSTPVTPAATSGTSPNHSSPFDNHHHHHNYSSSNHQMKPPIYLTNDQFIERVQIRAQQLIEEARERHSRINSQLMSSFRPITLDFNGDSIGHQHLRNHSSPTPNSFHVSSSHRSREPSPMTFLRRTSSFSDSDEFYLSNKFRRPSSSSTTTTPTTSTTNRSSAIGTIFNGSTPTSTRSSANSYKSARTCSTRLTNGNSQELDDDEDEDDFDYNNTLRKINGEKDDNLGDDLTSRAQVVSEALQKLKERALRED
ncbi:serine-rich adhesin for platelets-like isoform X2 [Panonychus citri]|nr:serine-rich adhesin for platelets-like isoform X2 [Panonychus citri]